jgi:hypothetical protein
MESTLAEEMNRREAWDCRIEDMSPWDSKQKERMAQMKLEEDALRKSWDASFKSRQPPFDSSQSVDNTALQDESVHGEVQKGKWSSLSNLRALKRRKRE